MTDIELLESIVATLEKEEAEEKREMEQFKERYDTLIDCAIDEINDDILRLKLNKVETTGSLMLIRDGNYPVYRDGILSSHQHLGGEEFTLAQVERNYVGKKSMMNVIFKPLDKFAPYSKLVIPYDKSLEVMSEDFRVMFALNLGNTMNSIEKDVLKLRAEMESAHRQRELRLKGLEEDVTYSAESSW